MKPLPKYKPGPRDPTTPHPRSLTHNTHTDMGAHFTKAAIVSQNPHEVFSSKARFAFQQWFRGLLHWHTATILEKWGVLLKKFQVEHVVWAQISNVQRNLQCLSVITRIHSPKQKTSHTGPKYLPFPYFPWRSSRPILPLSLHRQYSLSLPLPRHMSLASFSRGRIVS